MELATLAAKQKRAKDWAEISTQNTIQDPTLRAELAAGIKEFRELLANCWKNQAVTPADESKIIDLERKLEQLFEEGRLRVVAKVGGAPARVI